MALIKKIPASQTDEELLHEYRKKGDQNDVAILFSRYIDLVYGVCLKYLQNPGDAADAVMNVYEELVVKLKNHVVSQFPGWLYRVTSNHCLMRLRREKKAPQTVEMQDAFMQFRDFPHQDMQKEQHLSLMDDCLATLPPEQKEAITLFYFKEKCYKEIAGLCGQEVNKVRSFIQNGRRNLKICMEKKMQEE